MSPSGYTITVRLRATPEVHASGAIVSAVGGTGAVITGLDVVDPGHDSVTIDLTCTTGSPDNGDAVKAALEAIAGCTVDQVSDATFLIHLGGKLEIASKVPLRNRSDLARAYTPGVARICMAIYENPESARNLTIKRNSVAVVTDGTAVLGLGDGHELLGAAAA